MKDDAMPMLHRAAADNLMELMQRVIDEEKQKKGKLNLDRKDRLGKAPLHWAALQGHLGPVSLLLSEGASTETTDPQEATPLHIAAAVGRVEIAMMLIDSGGFVNSIDIFGNTPLFYATSQNHFELVHLLLCHGGDPLIKNNNGISPIDEATRKGLTDILLELKKRTKQ